MDEDTVESILLCHLQQSVEMRLLRVHAAVGDETEQMQPTIAGASVLHGIEQDGVREELAVLDHQIDAGDVHVNDAACTDVQMADLAVAHLAFGKANVRSAGVDER